MNGTLIWQIAIRYLRGKRTANIVPILSRISMVAIAVSSAAMIVVFSVFNGMEGLVKQLYKGFYPDVKITAARGKFFAVDAATLGKIKAINGVQVVTKVIEGNAFVNNKANNEQKVVTLKGIDKNYFSVNDIRDSIVGEDSVSAGNPYTAIGGVKILNELGSDVTNIFSTIELYYPNPNITNYAANPDEAIRPLQIHPAGMFHISDDFDDKYILAPLSLVQTLFFEEGKYTSLELKVAPGTDEAVQASLQGILGNTFLIETRYEQNKTMFMVMRTEKWAIYAILVMVLLVASFNMIGALSMLVLEKQKDMAILKAMGSMPGDIRKIFLLEGVLWALIGGVAGLVIGIVVCVLQQQFGLVSMGASFTVESYPVAMSIYDFILVLATISVVGILAAWYPAMRASRTLAPTLKSS